MCEDKKIDINDDADCEMEFEEVVAVIHQDKSITLEPLRKS